MAAQEVLQPDHQVVDPPHDRLIPTYENEKEKKFLFCLHFAPLPQIVFSIVTTGSSTQEPALIFKIKFYRTRFKPMQLPHAPVLPVFGRTSSDSCHGPLLFYFQIH